MSLPLSIHNMTTGSFLDRRRVCQLLSLAVLYFIGMGFLMQFPRYVLSLGATAEHAGWMLAIGVLPTLLLASAVSQWNQQVSGRWPVFLGCLISALSNAFMLSLDGVGVAMYLLRLTASLGHILVFATLFAQAAAISNEPAQRAQVIGWLAVALQVGNAIGGALGEAAYHHSLQVFWLGLAGILMAAGALGARWLHHTCTNTGVQLAEDKTVPTRWPAEIWGMMAIGMAFAGVTQFLPAFVDYLGKAGLAQPFASSWFLTPALLMVALVRLVAGQFAAKLLRPWVLLLCHTGLAATLLLLPWIDSKYMALASGVVFGLSYGWLYPALSALAFEHVPPQARNKVSGWLVTAFECGFRISPVGLGLLITNAGYAAMFMTLAAAYALILLATWLGSRKAPILTIPSVS